MKLKKTVAFFAVVLCFAISINNMLAVFAEPSYDCASGVHKDVVTARVEATNTEDGYETLKCMLCGRVYEAILYAKYHIWSEWITEKMPTCTEIGLRSRTCTRTTPHKDTEIIAALGHDYVITVVAPTCEENGTKTYKCGRCGDAYSEAGEPAHGHDYVESITKAETCTEDGVKTFSCTYNPEENYIESIPASGHKFGEWMVENPAGEGVEGVEDRSCSVCGEHEKRVIPALAKIEQPEIIRNSTFNELDAVAGTISLSLIGFFSSLLVPCVRTVNKERRDFDTFIRNKRTKTGGNKP